MYFNTLLGEPVPADAMFGLRQLVAARSQGVESACKADTNTNAPK